MIDIDDKFGFACDECPISCDVERRLDLAKEYGDFQFDHCSCDKINHYFYAGGYCEDAWVNKPRSNPRGKRRTGRQYRRRMKVQKFHRQRDIIMGQPTHGIWLNAFWDDENRDKIHYVMRRKNSLAERFYKRYSNRIVRRTQEAFPKGNSHHKCFDYQWTID